MIFNERRFLKARMEQISEERKMLKEWYQQLTQELDDIRIRLRELDREEEHPETYEADEVIDKLLETIKQLSRIIPEIPADIAFELWKKSKENKEAPDVESPSSPEIAHEKMPRYEGVKRGFYLNGPGGFKDLKEVSRVILTIIRENGGEIRSTELESILAEHYGLKWRNFTSAMNTIMTSHEPRIRRPYRGFYVIDESREE